MRCIFNYGDAGRCLPFRSFLKSKWAVICTALVGKALP